MLQYINEAARLRPLERKARKASGHRRVSFCKHLGDGIYVNLLCRKHIIDFRKHFLMYGESIRSVLSSRSGISIRMEDEWFAAKCHSGYTPSLFDVCQCTTAMWMSSLWC